MNQNSNETSVTHEVKAEFGGFQRTFEAFKNTNDQRLREIEKRFGADVLTEEKLNRINSALDEHKQRMDELMLSQARPEFASGDTPRSPYAREHRAGFDLYMRKGVEQGLLELESKALSVGVSADGGFLVPPETERQIDRLLSVASPIRSISGVQKISGNIYKKPFATASASTGWVGETAARPQTTTPTLVELSFPAMEIYAMPSATQTILDDAAVDTEAWLADEVQIIFAEQESLAFVSGDGVNKPKGFLAYTNVANASWTWGNMGYLATGVSAAFAASNPSDILVNLIYSLKQGYRANANWVLNRNVQADIRKFKDANGMYLWQPSVQAGQPSLLLGYPVAESEDMPNIAANSFSIAFGDFKRGYLIVDRLGIRVLRDPYTAKPYVLFYTTKRVGGGVQNFEAIKLVKFGVS
ncbi:MAG TPA: phage major capsid protein [Alphaproteobacteria bacterium]|nr:phage major capsid protein [Alphaproteobacteria bacterium]